VIANSGSTMNEPRADFNAGWVLKDVTATTTNSKLLAADALT